MDNYFSFHAATEENGGESGTHVRRRTESGGHPLVPKLNLPRPDPNEEWREIVAQQQSYDISSSSVPNEPSESESQSESEEESSEEEVSEEESESEYDS